ncbi:unnamed protein product [Trichobilharzia szidati]|nr:unnamed protein product [Trichobilharzia szidati]
MNIPDTDEDILGVSPEELNNILQSRDEIIQRKIVPELVPDVSEDYKSALPTSLSSSLTCVESTSVYDRLHAVFSTDPYLYDQELNRMGRIRRKLPTYIGISFGFITGAMRLVVSYDEFIRTNSLTIFRSQHIARRSAVDYSVLRAILFGVSTGCKVTLFTGGCYTLPLIFSAIQGKTSYWEYAAGWGITSSLYCFNRGLRQMFIAGVVGAVPGLITGVTALFAARKSNSTFEELLAKQLAYTKGNQA